MLSLGQRLVYAYYHVQMVGHKAHLPHLHHRVVMMYLRYLPLQYYLPQFRGFKSRSIPTSLGSTHQFTKHSLSASHHHRHLIRSRSGIVMSMHSVCLVVYPRFATHAMQRYKKLFISYYPYRKKLLSSLLCLRLQKHYF